MPTVGERTLVIGWKENISAKTSARSRWCLCSVVKKDVLAIISHINRTVNMEPNVVNSGTSRGAARGSFGARHRPIASETDKLNMDSAAPSVDKRVS